MVTRNVDSQEATSAETMNTLIQSSTTHLGFGAFSWPTPSLK